jgi:hypothetical protein
VKDNALKGIPGGAPRPKVVNLPDSPGYPSDSIHVPSKDGHLQGQGPLWHKQNPATSLPVGQKAPQSAYLPDGRKKKRGK